jgi:hypothetical protein
MTSPTYLDKDPDAIYEEFSEQDIEEYEDDYRNSDRMDDMINRYGRY